MPIYESKMAIDSSDSFLNCRKQHINLKFNYYLIKIENKVSTSKIARSKFFAIDQFRLHATWLQKPIKDKLFG